PPEILTFGRGHVTPVQHLNLRETRLLKPTDDFAGCMPMGVVRSETVSSRMYGPPEIQGLCFRIPQAADAIICKIAHAQTRQEDPCEPGVRRSAQERARKDLRRIGHASERSFANRSLAVHPEIETPEWPSALGNSFKGGLCRIGVMQNPS